MTNHRPTIQYTIKFTNLTKLMHVNASLWALKINITQGGSPCGEDFGFTMFYQIIIMGMFYFFKILT